VPQGDKRASAESFIMRRRSQEYKCILFLDIRLFLAFWTGKRTREIVQWSHREVDALPPPTARALGKRAFSKRNGHVGREEGEEDEADERREEEEEEQAAIGADGERRKALRLEKLPPCLRESVMGFMEEDDDVQGGKKG